MKKILAAVIIIIVLIFVAQGWWNSQLTPVSTDKEQKTIIIAKGKSLSEIANQLKKENLIRSEKVFIFYGIYGGAD